MDGILLVDKPRGVTSHDVVALIRKRFAIKKVGHAGTLDPIATGLLIILIGKYTKRSDEFLGQDKEYEAVMTLGATSDTLDAWGKVTASNAALPGSNKTIEDVFSKFTGPIEQAVPAYSAKKFKGKKLYELARKGIEVKMEPVKINIRSLEITGINLSEISFKAVCSKGTYIRQLCADIGAALGCGAYMSALRRTVSGGIRVDGAVSVEELKSIDAQALEKRLRLL